MLLQQNSHETPAKWAREVTSYFTISVWTTITPRISGWKEPQLPVDMAVSRGLFHSMNNWWQGLLGTEPQRFKRRSSPPTINHPLLRKWKFWAGEISLGKHVVPFRQGKWWTVHVQIFGEFHDILLSTTSSDDILVTKSLPFPTGCFFLVEASGELYLLNLMFSMCSTIWKIKCWDDKSNKNIALCLSPLRGLLLNIFNDFRSYTPVADVTLHTQMLYMYETFTYTWMV